MTALPRSSFDKHSTAEEVMLLRLDSAYATFWDAIDDKESELLRTYRHCFRRLSVRKNQSGSLLSHALPGGWPVHRDHCPGVSFPVK